jgi:ATP-dependent exoDNAse (exonuclease V) alpha subunit
MEEHWRDFFMHHPGFCCLAVRKVDVQQLNRDIVKALFTDSRSYTITTLEQDQCAVQEVYIGMHVVVNVNQNKALGVVNGAFGVIFKILPQVLVVEFRNGNQQLVHKQVSSTGDVGFPISPGYAVTIARCQGRTLPGICILPRVRVAAAAYVAVSRVRTLDAIWWVHTPQRSFFVPPRM